MSLPDLDAKTQAPVLKSLGKEFEVIAKDRYWPRPYPLFYVVTGLSALAANRYGLSDFKDVNDAFAALDILKYTESWSSETFAEHKKMVESNWKAYEASTALWERWDELETKVRCLAMFAKCFLLS